MKKFRFWLSWLIFEKIGKREPAQKKGERTAGETDEWNDEYGEYCYHCRAKEFVEDIRGSESLFSYPITVYKCTKCGNVQRNRGSHRHLFEELAKERIVEDGCGQYRYTIFTSVQWVSLVLLGFSGFMVGLVLLIL